MAFPRQEWPGEPPAVLASTSTHEILNPPSSGSLLGKAKRNRNALSCAECRRLKLKCSRAPWPCTSCIKRKCAHVCPDDVLKEIRPSRSKEVGALHERIHQLEQQLQSVLGASGAAPISGSSTGTYTPTGVNYQQEAGSGQDVNTMETSTGSSGTARQAHGGREEQRHPGISDVAEVMGTLMLGEDGSSRYLGKSAANALFHEEGSEEEEFSGSSDSEDDQLDNDISMRLQGTAFPMISRGLDVRDFQAMLPSISEARKLGDAYYHNCAYMFEPLKRAMFETHLNAAYEFSKDLHPITLEQLALVFMVFALGVLFDLDSDPRDPRASKYHTIAQACLTSAKFLNIPSLASIQCLHMMSTWHLTSHSQTGAFRAWPLLGLAGRMVLSTGLHRDGSIWNIPEPDLTIRRALFWEIVCYDRLQGMILGRPYMINSRQFDTAMPTEDPLNPDADVLTAHRARWEFSLLVGDLCDDCFSIGRPGYDTILRHDRRIRTFKEGLPQWLRFDPSADPPAEPPKPMSPELRRMLQQHTLTIQVHETLLFLHRVAFAQAIEHYPQEPLRSPWAQSVVSLCLEASRTLIAVARSAFHCYSKLAARWWHIQMHAFGAGVCFAAVCIKAPASALSRLAWTELCDAVALLESTSNEGLHARDLYPRLRKLRDQAQAKLEAYHLSPQAGVAGGRDNESSTPHNQLPHQSHLRDANRSSRDQSPDGEKLAVLGTATRKLEANFRHNPVRSASHGTGSGTQSAVSSVGEGAVQSNKNSPHSHASGQTPVTGSSPLHKPTNVPAGPGTVNDVPYSLQGQQQQPSVFGQSNSAVGSINVSAPTDSPVTTSYQSTPALASSGGMDAMQSYHNLDPGLAQLLANISNTPARETSAVFPPIEKNYGLARPSSSANATAVVQAMTVVDGGNQAQTLLSEDSSSGDNQMSYDMTRNDMFSEAHQQQQQHTGNTSEMRPSVFASPAPTNYTSPGREFFNSEGQGRRSNDNSDVIEPFTSALSPPPPGAPGEESSFEHAWMDYFRTPSVGLYENANSGGGPMLNGQAMLGPAGGSMQSPMSAGYPQHHQSSYAMRGLPVSSGGQQQQGSHHRQASSLDLNAQHPHQQYAQQQQQAPSTFASLQPTGNAMGPPRTQGTMPSQQHKQVYAQNPQQRYSGQPQQHSGFRVYDELLNTLGNYPASSGGGSYGGRT